MVVRKILPKQRKFVGKIEFYHQDLNKDKTGFKFFSHISIGVTWLHLPYIFYFR